MDDALIQHVLTDITRRIANGFRPEKIILFGSHAKGTPGPDSDVDLLVVMKSPPSRRQQAVQIDLALEGIPLPTDVIVVTPEDVEKYADCLGTIIHEAVRVGKVLYERAA